MNTLRNFCLIFLLSCTASALPEEQDDLAMASAAVQKASPVEEQGYTINYNTIAIIEYIRFASKICNVNFLFNEEDLDFTVTVVSDAPITQNNVMSTLLQMLRMHGLELLEQENNLVIHKAGDVKQLATIVTEGGKETTAPIVTRIFRLKNAKADSIAGIIRPMISTGALLEVSPETRQLILTDITANVDKVASLIEILDSPHTPFEITSYEVKNNSPGYLIEICSQIMAPIVQGDPFILVPQALANEIFIVSNPGLVEKALSVLQNLDSPPKEAVLHQRKLRGENIFVYKTVYRPSDEVLKRLREIADNLQKAGLPEGDLIDTIERGKSFKDTNSILLVGSKEAIAKVKEFLTALDTLSKDEAMTSSFFVYRPQNRPAAEVESALKEIAANLKETKGSDEVLVEMLFAVKRNHATNTLVFAGEEGRFTQIKKLLETIDTASDKSKRDQQSFIIYKIQKASFHDLESTLKDFAKNLDKSNVNDEGLVHAIEQMKYITETNALLFAGSHPALQRLQELLPLFDASIVTLPVSNQFFIYKPRYQKEDRIAQSIKDMVQDLKAEQFSDPAFLRTLETMKYIKGTNSLLFTGDSASIQRLENLLATIDSIPADKLVEKTFFLYAPKFSTKVKTENYFTLLANNLDRKNEQQLIEAIRSMKWIVDTKSFLFQGTAPALARIEEMCKNLDKPSEEQIFLHTPQFSSKEKIESYLHQLANSLDGTSEQPLIEVLRSAKWISDTRSFMFQGPELALTKLKGMLDEFEKNVQASSSNFFVYSLQYASKAKADQFLNELTESLEKQGGEEDLAAAIRSRKWVAESHSFMFNGPDNVLARIQELLKQLHSPEYYIYKLQAVSADVIEEDIDNLLKNFQKSGMKDSKIFSVLDNIRYVHETNSLLLTGDANAIEEAKKLIAQYDVPHDVLSSAASNFYMYKPKHLAAPAVELSLKDTAASLKKANLADKGFLEAIDSMKYVSTTNSLIFTGNAESIQKIKNLVQEIDNPSQIQAPIQHVGKTTFLLYKLKTADGEQVLASLKTVETNLKKSGDADKELLTAIGSAKYVKETNSLLFVGTEDVLKKVHALVDQFDVGALAKTVEKVPVTTSSNFYMYKPLIVQGPDLEKLLHDFAENLRLSGLSDPDLFNAILSMRYVDKTHTLVFTGTPKALDQVKELVKEFDVPMNLPGGAPAQDSSLQSVDNTSFLVYKLQFHKGDEIQGALRQIAKDLTNSGAQINQNLLNSINSIQWLDITNSLLCTGDQETLVRLKELIKNLDVPLKQVFIEILVIETSLTNALNFGLEWGGNYKFKNKFGVGTYNTSPPASTQTNFPDNFISSLSSLSAPKEPTPVSNIPPVTGFDLGVIGEVIKHKGQTFLTLGSLLSALQSDTETTIVNTPKILAQDGRSSTFFSGSNIPYTGSFVNNQQSGSVVQTANLEYRDIGLNLTITPVLGSSDIVTLDINLDREQSATDVNQTQLDFKSQTANGIITSKTSMQTTVHVPDRNFLILSGFINNSNTRQKAGIPCLGGLPLIGAAFSQANDTVSNANIVMFIRPYILNSIDDMRRLTSEQESFFRDQSPSPFLEHNYNEAVELIKTIDDE